MVARLREAGFDTEWIKESSPGAKDHDILSRPDIGALILLTNDRDFGDLIFNKRMPVPLAVIYTRLPHREAEQTAEKLVALLEGNAPAGQMITLNKDGHRATSFPIGASHG